jgi:hypothetical protein
MTVKTSPAADRNSVFNRLVTFLAKSGKPQDFADILGDATVKSELPESDGLLADAIKDLWSADTSGTQNRGEILVGPSQEASGGVEPERAAAHSDFARQKGSQLDAEKLGELITTIRNVAKSLNLHRAEMDVIKAAVISLAKADDEEKDKEVGKTEDTMEEPDTFPGCAKSVAPIMAEVKPLVATAKSKLETAKSMQAAKMGKSADMARFQAAEALVKASTLIGAALALAPAHAGIQAVAKSIEDMKEDCEDKDEGEAAKSKVAKADDTPEEDKPENTGETAKSIVPPDVLSKIEAAVAGHDILKGKMSDIIDILQGSKPLASIAKSVPNVAEAVAKSANPEAVIFAKRDSGEITENECAAALDLITIAKGARDGIVPHGVVEAKLRVTTDRVREIVKSFA